MSTGQDVLSKDERVHLMDAWKISEDVAMHFNRLLIGFRLKAIGGIAVSAVGAVVSIEFKFGNSASRALILTTFTVLAGIWFLVWAADFCYYYRLLAGAIDELLRLERRLGNVHLSHLIERRVRGKGPPKDDIELIAYDAKNTAKYPSWPIWMFYSVPTAILIWLAITFSP